MNDGLIVPPDLAAAGILTNNSVSDHRTRRRLYNRQWKANHPDLVKANSRRYYLRHRQQIAEKSRLWHKANPDLVSRKSRRWRLANPEQAKEATRRWRMAHADQVLAVKRRWIQAHPEKTAERNDYLRAWRKTHPEQRKIYKLRRRSRKLKNGGTLKTSEWLALKRTYDFRCLGCGRQEPQIKLEVDHIVPLSKRGRNDISNIQPLCRSCNSKKGTKTTDYRPAKV